LIVRVISSPWVVFEISAWSSAKVISTLTPA